MPLVLLLANVDWKMRDASAGVYESLCSRPRAMMAEPDRPDPQLDAVGDGGSDGGTSAMRSRERHRDERAAQGAGTVLEGGGMRASGLRRSKGALGAKVNDHLENASTPRCLYGRRGRTRSLLFSGSARLTAAPGRQRAEM